MRVHLIVTLLAVLTGPQQRAAQPDLSGDWTLAAATTNRSRNGGPGEQPTTSYLSEGSAFNCARECRIVHRDSTITVENALLKAGATARSPTVTIVVDGQPHKVVDSVNIGNTIETIGRWEDGKLLITSTLFGKPNIQTISLENNQLVVVRSFVTSDTKLTLRYTKK